MGRTVVRKSIPDYKTEKLNIDYNYLFYLTYKETVDLVTFTEKVYNGKLYFLCSGFKLMFGFGATRAVALDISEAFNRIWHTSLL